MTVVQDRVIGDILLVDDNPDNLKLLAKILTEQGFQVRASNSGRYALKAIKHDPPDLILLDVKMPGMDGFEVCRQLKANPLSIEIPIIFISALREEESKVKGFDVGGVDYITKPFQPQEILARVRTHLSMGRMRRHLEDMVQERTSELQGSEKKFRALFEQAGDYILLLEVTEDRGLVIVDANQAACETHGCAREEILGTQISHIDRGLDEARMRELLARVISGETLLFETAHIKKDGTIFPVEVSAKRLDTENDQTLIISIERDITERKGAEDALKASEEKYRRFYEDAPLGSQSLDASGNFLDVNKEWLRVLGYSKEEVIGRCFADFLASESLEMFARNFPRFKAGGATRGAEFDLMKKDGSRITVSYDGNIEYDSEGRFKRTHCIMHDISDRKRAEQRLLQNQTQLKSLASELVLAEERERKRIAIHMHDDVCQNLAYSKMKLQIVYAAMDDQTQQDSMTEVSDTLTRLMQDVRTLTFELSSPVLSEFGLEAAVSHWLTEQIEQRHGITTAFTDDGQPKPLEEDIQALLFRSVRELLTNVAKHSQANRVEVSLSREEDQIMICLEDDGIGFAPDKVVVGHDTGGFGLFSIRERLSQFEGSMDIDSKPGQGCKATLRAPLRQS